MHSLQKTQSTRWALIALVCGLATALSGCCNDPCCSQQGLSYEMRSMPCHGYHSTCWRRWPEDCCACPPYTATPPGGDDLYHGPIPPTAPRPAHPPQHPGIR